MSATSRGQGNRWSHTTHPMVVMKLDVNESSAKRSSRQLLPTPAHWWWGGGGGASKHESGAANHCPSPQQKEKRFKASSAALGIH